MTIEFHELSPAAAQGWMVLFELAVEDVDTWVLVGGQMVYLLAVEHDAADRARRTEDMDVVVDVRARRNGTEWLAGWLGERRFALEGIAPDGVGHRFIRRAEPGPGRIVFDVLAPEGLGPRANVFTNRPARTVQVPGSKQAIDRSEVVDVSVTSIGGGPVHVGRVRRPSLLAATIAKAAATTIPVRTNPERDWQDAALLLALIGDPIAAAGDCTNADRRRLRKLKPLREPSHVGWDGLSDLYDRGSAALGFLIAG